MTDGYRFEPTRLTRGYKTGYNEQYSFASQKINSQDYSLRAVIRPQFPSDTGENMTVLNCYNDGTHYFKIYYQYTSNKFVFLRYDSSTYYAYSPAQTFSQDDEVEIGISFDTTSGMKFYLNGSNNGAQNDVTTTAGAIIDYTAWMGEYPSDGPDGAYIIDDLEILAKSQPAEWFAEQHAKRNAAKNLNLPFKYSATLNAGDILTVNALDPKVRGRVEMYHASSGATSNGMGVANVGGSLMPILSPTKSMLYFPNSIPSGVEIYYRENHQ